MINEQAMRDALRLWIADLPAEQLLQVWRFRHVLEQESQQATEDWIPVAIAAQELRRNQRHVARLCATRLQFTSEAKLLRRDRGKPTWHVSASWMRRARRAYDARLATPNPPRAQESARQFDLASNEAQIVVTADSTAPSEK